MYDVLIHQAPFLCIITSIFFIHKLYFIDTYPCFRFFDHGYKFFATQGQRGQVKPGQLANLLAVSTYTQ